MDAIIDFLQHPSRYGLNVGVFVAGAVGAFVKMGNKNELTFWQSFFTVVSGGAIANYVTPAAFHFINIPDNMHFGFAFFFGFTGLESVKWLILKFKDKYGKD